MAVSLDHNNIMKYAPHAVAFACGAVVGYTLNTSGNLLSTVLINTGCGVSRVASTIIYNDPFFKQEILTHNATILAQGDIKSPKVANFIKEKNLQKEKVEFVNGLYKVSWAFSIGMTVGTGTSETSFLSGVLSGGLIHAVGCWSEVLPAIALTERVMKFDEKTGKQI